MYHFIDGRILADSLQQLTFQVIRNIQHLIISTDLFGNSGSHHIGLFISLPYPRGKAGYYPEPPLYPKWLSPLQPECFLL